MYIYIYKYMYIYSGLETFLRFYVYYPVDLELIFCSRVRHRREKMLSLSDLDLTGQDGCCPEKCFPLLLLTAGQCSLDSG